MIIVDTSVLIDLLRGTRTPATERFEALEAEGVPIAIPVVCAQELLQGARDEKEWKLLYSHLGTQDLVAPADPWATHAAAARIYFDCRRKGLTLRGSVDCLIAQIALDRGAYLLHDDEDFEKIARVRPLKVVKT